MPKGWCLIGWQVRDRGRERGEAQMITPDQQVWANEALRDRQRAGAGIRAAPAWAQLLDAA